MGRELQKKKRRSSIPKVSRKPKPKKRQILNNPIIAANW
jgi:nucleolar protein 16